MSRTTLEQEQAELGEGRRDDDSRRWRRSLTIDATLLIGVATVAFVLGNERVVESVLSNAQALTIVLGAVGLVLIAFTALELRKSASLFQEYSEARRDLKDAFQKIDERRARDERFVGRDRGEASDA
jgi:cobalamin biosynthesis protein CobD/CbiB